MPPGIHLSSIPRELFETEICDAGKHHVSQLDEMKKSSAQIWQI
jgi:hypothetical protein